MLAVTAAVLLINSSAYSGSFIPPQNKQNTTIIRNKKIPRPVHKKAPVAAHSVAKTVKKKNDDFSRLNR